MERCYTDDLMPNVPTFCLPPSYVDPEVQGLKDIIGCPRPGSSRVTYSPPPLLSTGGRRLSRHRWLVIPRRFTSPWAFTQV